MSEIEAGIKAKIVKAYRDFSARAEGLEKQNLPVARAAAEVVAVWYDAMNGGHSNWGEHLLLALNALTVVEPRLGSTDALWDAYYAYMRGVARSK